MWSSFGVLEYYAKQGGWNIRVDLLVFAPIIILTTIIALFTITRGVIKSFREIEKFSLPRGWTDSDRLRSIWASLSGDFTGMRKVLLLLVAALLLSVAYYLGAKAGQLPVAIHTLDNNGPYLTKWRRDWRSAPTKVVSATVVGNAPDKLYVYIDTVYTGEQGHATTCGNINGKHSSGAWSCSPTQIKERRGFTMLRFGLTSDARSIECSDSITVDMYSRDDGGFYSETFPFKKVWVKNPKGVMGKFREVFSLCPS